MMRFWFSLFAGFAFFSMGNVALAQKSGGGFSITVMPIVVEVHAPKVADNIVVRNGGRSPVRLQARVFRWQQKGGKDYYSPTTDVVVTPPFVNVKAGGDGTVRVVRVSKKPVAGEESYRVFVDQLPSPRVRGNAAGESAAGVQVVLRQVVPVFFYGGKGGQGQSAIVVSSQAGEGGVNITVRNNGAKRVRIADVVLLAGQVSVGGIEKLAGYALPNSEFKFFVPTKQGGAPNRIRFTTDAGPVEYPL